MLNQTLKDLITRQVLPRVKTPGQYVGGELNSVVKDHLQASGRLCLAFPDTYAIGMSNHGMQVLYHAMNRRPDWACERVFAPWPDMEEALRRHGLPLYSLETFTPLDRFDLLGFTLQYDLCCANVLTILDLGGIPLRSVDRSVSHPLVIAGGPCAQNPEPMAPFIDLFVIGDGEETLPRVCDAWLRLKSSGGPRAELLAEMGRMLAHVYVPQCYQPRYDAEGRARSPLPAVSGLPELVRPAIVEDLDGTPLPTSPVVPNVEAVHDRIAMEIMRGCPWRCRFCQATAIKRPLRLRRVDTLVEAALESYRNTGYNEISLLSLSTSDYPYFDELLPRMQEALRPLDVAISVPSLRVNEQLRTLGQSLETQRHSGMTLAPEVALDDMREQIGKRIRNDDLFEGCKTAFENGFNRVKLYFMCGLPGERTADLDGIVDMAEHISRIGKQVAGKLATVVANVSNFVPKSHSPYQWNAMQRADYFREAHRHLWRRRQLRTVDIKCHDVETSILEGVFSRGDRRVADAVELAWRRGARFDSWHDQCRPERWHEAIRDVGLDLEPMLHRPYPLDASLPWDHIAIRQGRNYLEREQGKAVVQLAQLNGSYGPRSV
ncbi:MAG: TIGR03960 family B12-binding radical SAM protein [Pirellulales bacterium]|nr:TIGR03960 family B12-binding radical SAM protein [Pirellulales bacterium]